MFRADPDEFERIYEPLDVKSKKIHIVDSGLTFNLPYPLILRPQRGVDLIISFDFSARPSDSSPPFKVSDTGPSIPGFRSLRWLSSIPHVRRRPWCCCIHRFGIFLSTSRQNIALCLSSCLHAFHEATGTKRDNEIPLKQELACFYGNFALALIAEFYFLSELNN